MTQESSTQKIGTPTPPLVRLSIGITGHRARHAEFAANRERIAVVLAGILDLIDAAVTATPRVLGPESLAATRLHTLLADGTDRLAAEMALQRGYELIAPLPFGRRLNKAINSLPVSAADARALLAGGAASDSETQEHADAIRRLTDHARVFSLADQDERIAALFLDKLDAPDDFAKAQLFAAESSRRVALAGNILIEQSDLLVAVWDGVTTAHIGGSGHTIEAALDLGAPVIWIDPAAPENWRILQGAESLAQSTATVDANRDSLLASLVQAVLRPDAERASKPSNTPVGGEMLRTTLWRGRSNWLFHAYRRIEALFGGDPAPFRGLRQSYESPDAIATGSAAGTLAAMQALPDYDQEFAAKISDAVLRRFAWADGIATRFSDLYRGGMVTNFLASGLAIVCGIAYLPFVDADHKWPFALAEFALLASILIVTALGQKRKWHKRWFETRRVAEYFRHSPILLALGVARAPGRWLKGTETSWPEWYARQGLREVGLPRVVVSQAYLRAALQELLDDHVVRQRDYHQAKARRLTNVHRNLDKLSETLFLLAVISVALYLSLRVGSALSVVPETMPHSMSKFLTFLGVLFPTFGATVAGIRYFGDFERFAAISAVTAAKLNALHQRILLLLAAPTAALEYGSVTDFVHETDEIVITEIENWQAVFGSKHITVPV